MRAGIYVWLVQRGFQSAYDSMRQTASTNVCLMTNRCKAGRHRYLLLLTFQLCVCVEGNWGTLGSKYCMEKAMAPHSSSFAWKIPLMEEPGRLQSMGSLRVRHDWATSLSLFTFMHWRGKWQPTPVFLPGESQGRGSLVGCRLWDRTESDTNEVT